jgi:hypothetical protein
MYLIVFVPPFKAKFEKTSEADARTYKVTACRIRGELHFRVALL